MSTVTFDTLKFADTLKAAGVPAAQAEAEARALSAAIGEIDVATKGDLEAMESRIDAKIDKLFVDDRHRDRPCPRQLRQAIFLSLPH